MCVSLFCYRRVSNLAQFPALVCQSLSPQLEGAWHRCLWRWAGFVVVLLTDRRLSFELIVVFTLPTSLSTYQYLLESLADETVYHPQSLCCLARNSCGITHTLGVPWVPIQQVSVESWGIVGSSCCLECPGFHNSRLSIRLSVSHKWMVWCPFLL